MKQILPRTLFWQLVLATAAVQTVFLGGFISYIVLSERNVVQERTQQRIVHQLDLISAACVQPLETKDIESLDSVLELSRISSTIEVARVTDLQGHTIAASQNGRDHGLDAPELAVLPHATQQVFKIRNGQTEAVTPILHDNKPIALLWLEPNHSAALSALGTIIRIALSYGVFALLVNIIPIFLLVRSMTKPLRKLREATQSIGRERTLPSGFPLPITTKNEAGELTLSFNTMVGELEAQRGGLLETLALLDSMLGNAPIGFAFFDRDLRHVRLNQFLADMFGGTIEQYVGRRGSELYPASVAEEAERHIASIFETGEGIRNVELSGESPAGSGVQRSWLVHFYPVRTEQDTIRWVGAVVVEITDRLQAEETLRKTEKLAAAGRLAASIAHEINNPLESVTNLLFLLSMHEPMDPEAMAFIETAQGELARVSEITQQMLRFYRQSTFPTSTQVPEVLDAVVSLYQPRMVHLGIEVVRKFGAVPPVFGFGGELRQLFANLIGNAIDAMPDGGKLILRTRAGSGLHPDGSWGNGLRVSVADTGMGMSEETRRRIFEAFFTTKQASGTGLGLWVSDEIVRKHSGTIRAKSVVGVGTCFMVFFPEVEAVNSEQLTANS
jgi:PAS domain S-box-containing protein